MRIVRFVQSTVRSIDPSGKRVETDAGPFEADILVVALGADLDPDASPTGSWWTRSLLETTFPGVYAVGDVTSVGTPKAGVFAEGQAAGVAERIAAMLRNDPVTAKYGGNGMCWLDFGGDQIAKVDVTFLQGQKPFGDLEGPSSDFVEDKLEFGRSRVARWFG
jgi:NADPH-dependent 2,4-dienoyl-CoA reductase/sulfur reductase-like enzyme